MNRIPFALLLLLAACSSSEEPKLATEPTVHIAESALDSGNSMLSLQISQAILRIHPHNVDAMIVRGDAFFTRGAITEATLWYQRALKQSPHSVHALVGMGRIHLETDPAKSEAYFQRALGEDPRSVAALNDLGIACDIQGRHGDAQSFYRRALALAPDNSDTLVNLGLSLVRSGDRSGALEILHPLATTPDLDMKVKRNLANALKAAGDPDGAERVLQSDPNNPMSP
jgi:Flp pilus assembly protein TadD